MGIPGEAVGLWKQQRDHNTRAAIQQRSVWVAADIVIGDRDAFASLSSSTLNERGTHSLTPPPMQRPSYRTAGCIHPSLSTLCPSQLSPHGHPLPSVFCLLICPRGWPLSLCGTLLPAPQGPWLCWKVVRNSRSPKERRDASL